MMFGFGRAGSPSRPVHGLHPALPWAARSSAPTNDLPVIYVSLNTHLALASVRPCSQTPGGRSAGFLKPVLTSPYGACAGPCREKTEVRNQNPPQTPNPEP